MWQLGVFAESTPRKAIEAANLVFESMIKTKDKDEVWRAYCWRKELVGEGKVFDGRNMNDRSDIRLIREW